tara:strand:+ start:2201 stop:2674 length:474 start_codon:yes stop_codon:yes gene_type:complete
MNFCRVLFVCLGNICRSPTAQAIFEKRITEHGLEDLFEVDSCGTGSWHIGKMPDPRAIEAAEKRGYSLNHIRARRIQIKDFDNFDYLVAMDRENLKEVEKLLPENFYGNVVLFSSFIKDSKLVDVPDPYYGGERGFDEVIDMIELGASGFLNNTLSD